MHSTYRVWCFWNRKKATPSPRLPLNIGIWTAVRRTQRKEDIDRNNKLNNKITIISTEQTVVHHPNRHVALALMCSKRDFIWNHELHCFFLLLSNLPTFKLPGLFHTLGPRTENAGFPNWVRVRRTYDGLSGSWRSEMRFLWVCRVKCYQASDIGNTTFM